LRRNINVQENATLGQKKQKEIIIEDILWIRKEKMSS
jgi:hypothetical protein